MRRLASILLVAFVLNTLSPAGMYLIPRADAQTVLMPPADEQDTTDGVTDDNLPDPTAKATNLGDPAKEINSITSLIDAFTTTTQAPASPLSNQTASQPNGAIKPLRLSATDQIALEEGKIDKRVIESLLLLTKPKELGGFGHSIKVSRIIKNYRGNKKQYSKESQYEENEPRNISAHSEDEAQAYDISEIDTYQCKIKKLTGSKKTPPKPIQVAWQEKVAGQTIGDTGNNPSLFGSDIPEIGTSIVNSLLGDALADNLNFDLETFNLKNGSLADIIDSLGRSAIEEQLGIALPRNGQSTEDFAKQIGAQYLAKQTGLSPQVFTSKNKDEFLRAAARDKIAKELNIALTGNSVEDWVNSAAKRKLETTLHLDQYALETVSLDNLPIALAEAKFSDATGNSLDKVSKLSSPTEKTNAIGNPGIIDTKLGLPAGTTANFVNNKTSRQELTNLIATSLKNRFLNDYKRKDDALNLPAGTIEAIFSNSKPSKQILASIGVSLVAEGLHIPEENRAQLLAAASQTGAIGKLDTTHANSSIIASDLITVFNPNDNGRNDTLARIGQSVLDEIVKNNNKDLYTDYKSTNINDIANNKNLSNLLLSFGSQYLENQLDLDSGTISGIIRTQNSSISDVLKNSAQAKLYETVAKQLNQELGFSLEYKNSNYTLNASDVASLLRGNTRTSLDKLGSMLLEQATNSLKGNAYDYISGSISSDRFLANTALSLITERVLKKDPNTFGPEGLVNNKDQRLGKIITLLSSELTKNNQSLTPARILYYLEIDEDEAKGYNFNSLSSILTSLKDPSKNASQIQSDAISLIGEYISIKSGLPSGTIGTILTNPKDAPQKLAEYGMQYIETGLGLPSGILTTLYKDNKVSGPGFLRVLEGKDAQEALAKIIAQKTGITIPTQAGWFTDGNLGKGIQAWALAQFAEQVNQELSNPAAKVAYDLLAHALFGDKDFEQNYLSKLVVGINGGSLGETEIANGIRLARTDLRASANYGIMDATLIKQDSSIPVGFSQAMLRGSDSQRLDILKQYAINKVGFSDQLLGQKTGLPILPGTADLLIKGDFNKIIDNYQKNGQNFAQGYALQFADNALGLPTGSTQQLYNNYKQYQSLKSAYEAGKISSGQLQSGQIALAVTVIDTITGGAISKFSSKIDDALGLPSGTTFQAAMALATGNVPLAIATVVMGILGFGKMKCPDLQKLSREKVRTVLDELMQTAQNEQNLSKEAPLIPTQILTWRQEDIDYIQQKYGSIFGPVSPSNKAGIFKSLTPKEIHVGF